MPTSTAAAVLEALVPLLRHDPTEIVDYATLYTVFSDSDLATFQLLSATVWQFDVVAAWLARGAAVHVCDSTQATPLLRACRCFQNQQLPPNQQPPNQQPPNQQQQQQHENNNNNTTAVLQLLLQHGARPHQADVTGVSPLSYSVQHGRVDWLDLFLMYRINTTTTTTTYLPPPMPDYPALWLQAAQCGHVGVVEYLWRHITSTTATHSTTKPWTNARGETALHLAVRSNQVDVLRCLLEYCRITVMENRRNLVTDDNDETNDDNGVDTNHDNQQQQSAPSYQQHFLVPLGATDHDDEATPLWRACQGRHRDCLRVMLWDYPDLAGPMMMAQRSPLLWACRHGDLALLGWLVQVFGNNNNNNQNDNNHTDNNNNHYHNNSSYYQLDWHVSDPEGTTTVLAATQHPTDAVLRAVLGYLSLLPSSSSSSDLFNRNHGCLLHRPDHNDTTPLSWATAEGRADLVQILLEAGAPCHDGDDELTPFLLALALGAVDLVQLMLARQAVPPASLRAAWQLAHDNQDLDILYVLLRSNPAEHGPW